MQPPRIVLRNALGQLALSRLTRRLLGSPKGKLNPTVLMRSGTLRAIMVLLDPLSFILRRSRRSRERAETAGPAKCAVSTIQGLHC